MAHQPPPNGQSRTAAAAPAPPVAEAGVVGLLKRLRMRICCDARGDFRRILPAYERVLTHRNGAEVSVHPELLRIRGRLLACGGDAHVFNVIDRLDQAVESCLAVSKAGQEQHVPVEETMRLLVALAGGEDGETFVLEDPTCVTVERSVFESKRIGDRIQMSNVELVQRSRGLFDRAPVPLEADRLLSRNVFEAFGSGISPHHASLWCPDATAAQDEGFLLKLPLEQGNRFMTLAPDKSPASDTETDGPPKRLDDGYIAKTDAAARDSLLAQEAALRVSPTKEVFFFDGTHEFHCGDKHRQQLEYVETSSMQTENSSWDSESSLDLAEPWAARTYAWEDLGDRSGLAESYFRPRVREKKRSLRDLVIPAEVACNTGDGKIPLEVHEADLIDDSLRALSGIESTIFRRDCQSATFKLPEKRELKLRNATLAATTSVLEVFRKAGSIVVRLELLAIYYSQDPARGGKTLQAMGNALLLYLSMHRELVQDMALKCAEPSFDEMDGDNNTVSIAQLIAKTRTVCRVLETVAQVFSCDGDTFWPLLLQGEFPGGVAWLDRLHRHVTSLRVEDASGSMLELLTWFLVKSCSPLLAVLSDLIASGKVDESTDPFDEFKATVWSRNLLEKAASGGGDGLFCEEEAGGDFAAGMLPIFLEGIAPRIIHLAQVQALLRSMKVVPSHYPLVATKPLVLLNQLDGAVQCAEEWHSTVTDVMRRVEADQKREEVRLDPDAENKTEAKPVFAGEDSWLLHERERAAVTRTSQLKQREVLDQQVLDTRQRNLELVREEAANDEKRSAEESQKRADQEAYGRKVLHNKYAALMAGAEERHDYMKWRRDRALRFSAAKGQLRHLHEDDMIKWRAEMQGKKDAITAGETKADVAAASFASSLEEATGVIVAVSTDGNGQSPGNTDIVTASSIAGAELRAGRAAGIPSITGSSSEWRASVKVNKEAGSRGSGLFNNVPSADAGASARSSAVKTTVRVSHQPGGGGADVYAALYGGPDQASASASGRAEEGVDDAPLESSATQEWLSPAAGDSDLEVSGDVVMVDQSGPTNDEPSGETLSEIGKGGDDDILMDDATQNGEERDTNSVELDRGRVAIDTGGEESVTEPAPSARVCLPATHPFFSQTITKEDAAVLLGAMTTTSATLKAFTPFALIVNCCVETPVRAIADEFERVALNWFRDSLQLVGHLRWLRKLMLMSEGLCMDIFARDFLRGLSSSARVNWGVDDRLTSALTLAMIEGSVTSHAIVQSFHYKTTDSLSQVLGSRTMVPAVPSLLSEIALVYEVQWPLGLVITAQSRDLYTDVHRFLLYVRLTTLEMREAWGMLRTIGRHGQLPSALQRSCGDAIYKIQSFLGAFIETFSTKVLMASWSELERALQKATTLAELRCCHEEYVADASCCCFLDVPAHEIHSAFTAVLAATWSLTGFIRGLDRQVTGRAAEENRVRALCREHDSALRALVAKLHSLGSDTERNVRDFSECLLLRVNFNGYYPSDSPTAEAAASCE